MAQTRLPLSVSKYIFACMGLVLWHCMLYTVICSALMIYNEQILFWSFNCCCWPTLHIQNVCHPCESFDSGWPYFLSCGLIYTTNTTLHRMFVYLHLLHNWKRSPLFCSLLLSFMSGPHVWRTRKSHVNNFSEVVAGTIAWREITKGEYILWSSIEKYGSVLSCW